MKGGQGRRERREMNGKGKRRKIRELNCAQDLVDIFLLPDVYSEFFCVVT